jgi:hypothetical protein
MLYTHYVHNKDNKINTFYPYNNWYQLQSSLRVGNFISVICFTISGFNLLMYSLKTALSC